MGTENYGKLKYWETTGFERHQTGEFKRYLQSRSLPLTEQQEAAVVDAMHQAREGKVSFSLTSPYISMEDKLAHIDTLKQSLTPVLNVNDLALLEQHLKEVAGKTMTLQALNEARQKSVTNIQKMAEEKKRKASSPPAAPR